MPRDTTVNSLFKTFNFNPFNFNLAKEGKHLRGARLPTGSCKYYIYIPPCGPTKQCTVDICITKSCVCSPLRAEEPKPAHCRNISVLFAGATTATCIEEADASGFTCQDYIRAGISNCTHMINQGGYDCSCSNCTG